MRKNSLIFWDLLSRRYSRQPIADDAAYQKKLEITRTFLRPNMEVMELGCGTGSTAIIHAPHVRHILAIDGSAQMIKIAKDKADAKGIKNITFECITIDSLTLQANSVDIIMGMSILHLLGNRNEIIKKVFTMLKPGGIFITSTICLGDTVPFATYIAPIGRVVGLTLKIFTLADLRQAMEQAGFAIDYEWRPSPEKAAFIIARKPQ